MDDEYWKKKVDEVDPEVTESSCSSWPLSHDSDSIANSYLFGNAGGGGEFGWNFPPPPPPKYEDEQQSGSYGGHAYGDHFDRIMDSDLAGANSPTNPTASVSGSGGARSSGGMETQKPMVSSSSSEDRGEKSTASGGSTRRAPSADTTSKVKKKGQKRIRQPRYAFMTKSKVDHLEDGYRWRKYGQKAVKNSSYPRSYYRCTNTKCTVKKRVERSSEDPTIVITTYEGQHCHHTVGFPRINTQFPTPLLPPPSSTNSPRMYFRSPPPPPSPGTTIGMQFTPRDSAAGARESFRSHSLPPERYAPPASTDEGLLEDIVPPGMRNT